MSLTLRPGGAYVFRPDTFLVIYLTASVHRMKVGHRKGSVQAQPEQVQAVRLRDRPLSQRNMSMALLTKRDTNSTTFRITSPHSQFSSQASLQIPEQRSKNLQVYKCSQCFGGFLSPELLEEHILSQHSVCDAKHKCSRCSKSFHSKEELHQHRKTHYVYCRICNRNFSKPWLLRGHHSKVHQQTSTQSIQEKPKKEI